MSLAFIRIARTGRAILPSVASILRSSRAFANGKSDDAISEAEKAFYTYGVSLASKSKNVITLSAPNELEQVARGFSHFITNKISDLDENILYAMYGPSFQKLMDDRINSGRIEEKKRGAAFITKYLEENKATVKTESGLVFHEKLKGNGIKVVYMHLML